MNARIGDACALGAKLAAVQPGLAAVNLTPQIDTLMDRSDPPAGRPGDAR
jgi:hypothetical protein